ncbi:MAG: hypothetical protein R2788_18335 [Saprospiraceae bacterium]
MLSSTAFTVTAQQLYLEGFTARQRTNYNMSPYQQSQIWYSPLGFRVAGGTIKVQTESRFNLKDLEWTIRDTARSNIALGTHTFYFLLLWSIGQGEIFPLSCCGGFGLNIIAGAGLTNVEGGQMWIPNLPAFLYDQTPTYNGTVGISIQQVNG